MADILSELDFDDDTDSDDEEDGKWRDIPISPFRVGECMCDQRRTNVLL